MVDWSLVMKIGDWEVHVIYVYREILLEKNLIINKIYIYIYVLFIIIYYYWCIVKI